MKKNVAVTVKHQLPIFDSGVSWSVDLVDNPDEVMLKDVQSKTNPLIIFDIVAQEHNGNPKFVPSNIRYPKWKYSIDDINRLEESLVKKREFCPRCKSLEEVLRMMYDIKKNRPPEVTTRLPSSEPMMMPSPGGVGKVEVKTYLKDVQPEDLVSPGTVIEKGLTSVDFAVSEFEKSFGGFVEGWTDMLLNPFKTIDNAIEKSRRF